MDYCKDELTTGQRVGTAAFGAVISTIVGVGAIWMLLIEETFIGWIFLAHLPYAISQWVAVFRSGVRSLRGGNRCVPRHRSNFACRLAPGRRLAVYLFFGYRVRIRVRQYRLKLLRHTATTEIVPVK